MRMVSGALRRAAEWAEAAESWMTVPAGEREVLKKYVRMFLGKLPEEDFPEEDKKILKRHAKSFLGFLKGVE